MNEPIRTVVAHDPTDLARRVAQRIAEISSQTEAERCAIALSGGSTPQLLYETLAAPPLRESVRWERLELFFSDERSVPLGHPHSNYGMVQRALLARVQVTAHRMPAERGAAEEYERLVRERVEAREDGLPAFDLMLLGLGKDGHTASLFPGTKALDEQERLVVMIDVPQLEARRMTFTYTLINAAMRVWVLATGGDKAAIVRQCLEEQQDPKAPRQWPVLGVRPKRGELIWWLDRASAGQSEICRGPR